MVFGGTEQCIHSRFGGNGHRDRVQRLILVLGHMRGVIVSLSLAASLLMGDKLVNNADTDRIRSKRSSTSCSHSHLHIDVGSHDPNRSPFDVTGPVVHEIPEQCRWMTCHMYIWRSYICRCVHVVAFQGFGEISKLSDF